MLRLCWLNGTKEGDRGDKAMLGLCSIDGAKSLL